MRQYSINAIWLVFEKSIRIFVTTFVAFYIARYLGPDDFGQLSYALAWLAILGSISSLGIDGVALKEISNNASRVNAILSTGIILKLIASLVLLLTVYVIYILLSGGESTKLILIASCAIFFQPYSFCEIFFQANAESKKIIRIQVLQSFVSSLLKLSIIYLNGPIEALLWSYVFDAFFLGIGVYRVTHMQDGVKISVKYFDYSLAKRLLVTAFPILLTGISVAAYMKIDLIMLESMAQPNQLGIYSAAAKLSEMWYFIPVAICAAFSPLLFKLRNESDVLFEMKLRELYSLLMWGSIAIGIVVSIFNEEIIRIAFGERFGGAGQVFLIHIWSGIFVCIGLVNSVSLLSSNRLYQNFARTFLGALINVILNLVLIPRFGALGAAYATLIAYAFTAWLSMLFFRNGLYEFLLPIKSLSTIPKVIS